MGVKWLARALRNCPNCSATGRCNPALGSTPHNKCTYQHGVVSPSLLQSKRHAQIDQSESCTLPFPFPSLDRCATASLSAISSGIAPALLPILNPRSAGTQRQDRGLPSPAPHTAAPPSPKIRRPSTFFFFLFRFLLTSVPIWYILVSKMYTQAGSQPAQRPLPTILWAVLSLYPCDRTTQLEPFQSKITPTTRTISDSDTPAAAKISNLHNQKKKG